MYGNFELKDPLGKESLGELYLAVDSTTGREAVIRTLVLEEDFEPHDEEEIRKRFFREAEAAARLHHPAIRRILGSGITNKTAWVAMEPLHGAPLTEHINGETLLPWRRVLEIGAKIAVALHYAHTAGVIHRDIRPDRIFFDPCSDGVTITDFGFAHITDPGRTRTGMVLGVPSYKAPEQLAAESVTPASDLFSLGVTLYQLLTGMLPFRAESMVRLMQAIVAGPHVPPTELRPELPAILDDVMARALAKSPEDRYESGEALASALRECAASDWQSEKKTIQVR